MSYAARQHKKALKAKAKEAIEYKRGFKTAEEKRAYRIAQRQRKALWKQSLESMSAEQRAHAVRERRELLLAIHRLPMLIAAAAALLVVLLIIML